MICEQSPNQKLIERDIHRRDAEDAENSRKSMHLYTKRRMEIRAVAQRRISFSLFSLRSPRLCGDSVFPGLSPENPISSIPQSRQNVASLIKPAVECGAVEGNFRVLAVQIGDPFRGRDQADEPHIRNPSLLEK